jgi:competence protein ComGC
MSGRSTSNFRAAFTLLEMILALMITSMTVMTLYRFVSAHLATIRASSDMGEERDTLHSVVQFVQGQMDALPLDEGGVVKGQAFKFHGLSSDEITWRCPAGPGLLTTAASGDFLVTLAVQPVDEHSTDTELGLRRQPAPENKAPVDLRRGGAGGHYDWLSLARPMAAVEIRYFDPQLHSWTDAWTDPARRPSLVRLRLWRHADDEPLEAVISVPSARLSK